jgi:hypothetical protein
VSLHLTNGTGSPIARSVAAALAGGRDVHVILQGRGMRPVTAICSWSRTARAFECSLRLPAVITDGRLSTATLTATENVGAGFGTVPGVRGSRDPQAVSFR